jgi:hypothetical protein
MALGTQTLCRRLAVGVPSASILCNQVFGVDYTHFGFFEGFKGRRAYSIDEESS